MVEARTRPLSQSFTILIVTYNSIHEIGELLNDLVTCAPQNRIVIVDNASQDGSADWISSQYPDIQLVRNPVNVGYARAVNQGARLCKTPYLLLLNPDIRILDPAVFTELLGCMESNPQIAAAAPVQFKTGKSGLYLNFTWSYWSPRAFRFYWAQHMQSCVCPEDPLRVFFLNAGCLFLRLSAFEQVGMFNMKYFLYGEEPDLFLKFLRYGYECRLLTHVKILHHRERSIGRVKPVRRLRYRMMALWNIGDALIKGLYGIFYDRLFGLSPNSPPSAIIEKDPSGSYE